MKPTAPQRKALVLAAGGKLTERNASRATLDAIWDAGWITWRNPRLRFTGRAYLTPEGVEALTPPPENREQRPVYLTPARDAHSYTTSRSKGVPHAGEVLEPAVLKRFTKKARDKERQETEARIAAAQQARDLMALEDRIVAAFRAAQDRGVNVRREMEALRRTLRRSPTPAVKDATVRRLKMVERKIDTRRAA